VTADRAPGLLHVLLLVQGALSGLVTAEALLLAAVERSPALLALAALSGAMALAPVGVAFGLAAGWGRARGVGAGYEVLLLVSGFANAIVLGNDDLVSVLFTLVLPAGLLWLLGTMSPWSGAASRAGSTRS
jgi:hypothetical protein